MKNASLDDGIYPNRNMNLYFSTRFKILFLNIEKKKKVLREKDAQSAYENNF